MTQEHKLSIGYSQPAEAAAPHLFSYRTRTDRRVALILHPTGRSLLYIELPTLTAPDACYTPKKC